MNGRCTQWVHLEPECITYFCDCDEDLNKSEYKGDKFDDLEYLDQVRRTRHHVIRPEARSRCTVRSSGVNLAGIQRTRTTFITLVTPEESASIIHQLLQPLTSSTVQTDAEGSTGRKGCALFINNCNFLRQMQNVDESVHHLGK